MLALAEKFLNANQSDPVRALESACQEIITMSQFVSPGWARWAPLKEAWPPKPRVEPLTVSGPLAGRAADAG